jgi:hypothetical protein
MHANAAVSKSRLRHFDRGQRLLTGLAGALLLVACSGDLVGDGQPGTAGSPGSGQGGGGTGGAAGLPVGRIAGAAGMSFGGVGGGGTGGAAGMSFGGIGGGGTGGFGDNAMLPVCPTGTPSFSVCVVSDADLLPLTGTWRDSIIAAAATVEAVGTGTAPAQCASARVFGAATSSDWWVQVRTASGLLWTIGLGGLESAPVVQAGDAVRLDLDYARPSSFWGPALDSGYVQLSNTTGTPLLWAGSTTSGVTWLSLAPGQPLCGNSSGFCPITRFDVTATINGSVATVAPFSAVYLAGYYVVIGQYNLRGPMGNVGHTGCAFDGLPPFAAAAVKTP